MPGKEKGFLAGTIFPRCSFSVGSCVHQAEAESGKAATHQKTGGQVGAMKSEVDGGKAIWLKSVVRYAGKKCGGEQSIF